MPTQFNIELSLTGTSICCGACKPVEKTLRNRSYSYTCREFAFADFREYQNPRDVRILTFGSKPLHLDEICTRLQCKYETGEAAGTSWRKDIRSPTYTIFGNDEAVFLAWYWAILDGREAIRTSTFAEALLQQSARRLWGELVDNNRYPTTTQMWQANTCPIWYAEQYWWEYED